MSPDPFLNHSLDQGGLQMPALRAGQRLFNQRYELLHLLGAGGMGVVWLARDHTEEADVALKFLPSVLVLQPAEMRRLKNEVRAGKEVRHPNIVATYALEVEHSVAAIVMEYVPGKNLKELLDGMERGFFEPEEIARWAQDVASAIDYLHTKARRIHRDVKPANVIVDSDGEARLMDFGISSRIQEGLTRHSKTSDGRHGESSSTLAYASPQQLGGKPAHLSDDLYSLGATLYEMLTGTPPFYRGGAEAVAIQIKAEPVTPLQERRAELCAEGINASTGHPLPAAVEQAVLASLAKEREARPESAGQLVEAFLPPDKPAEPPPAPAPPPSVPATTLGKAPKSYWLNPEPRHTARRRRWPAVLVSVLVLAGAGVAGRSFLPPAVVAAVIDPLQKKWEQAVAWYQARNHGTKAETKAETKTEIKTESKTEPKKEFISTRRPRPTTFGSPAEATKDKPFINSLGMGFVPSVVLKKDGTVTTDVLFSIWETRGYEFADFLKESGRSVEGPWKTCAHNGVPVGRSPNERMEDSHHPVSDVPYEYAGIFCEWLTKKERAAGILASNDAYRLPTDAEWSYAAGIGSKEDSSATPADKSSKLKDVYPWGSSFPPPARSGNYLDASARLLGVKEATPLTGYDDGYATTAPVGTFPPNSQGLYDMGGNVWEWTSTSHYASGNYRTLRGGSWLESTQERLLSSARTHSNFSGNGDLSHGFRCVLAVARKPAPAPAPPPQASTPPAASSSLPAKTAPPPAKSPPSSTPADSLKQKRESEDLERALKRMESDQKKKDEQREEELRRSRSV